MHRCEMPDVSPCHSVACVTFPSHLPRMADDLSLGLVRDRETTVVPSAPPTTAAAAVTSSQVRKH